MGGGGGYPLVEAPLIDLVLVPICLLPDKIPASFQSPIIDADSTAQKLD
jgi:hypothetical protein